ncbi:MAG: ABC transporter substrate-binding protein, partial [Candidatus Bathyarchaeota archaeon]|nr:ABC transporter substrate-binding protein [Candidatus Bathyarchaeota archaeon]
MGKAKAIARITAIFIIIVVILVASIIGIVWVFVLQPKEAVPLPGEFELSQLTVSPSSVSQGQSATISVKVTNTGETEITGTITLALNSVIESTKEVTVAASDTETVTFTVTKNVGTYTVTIPGTTLTAILTVVGGTPAFVTQNKLIYESDAQFQWLDPHVSYFQFDYWTLWHSVETLVWYERDNATKVIPWLAESYTVSSDQMHYNFTLRQGITFQDGTKFNATAVWFSFNRLFVMDGTSGDGLNHGSQAAWMVQQLADPDG